MLIRLDMASATPIYVQLRNQIVMGIGTGKSFRLSGRWRQMRESTP